MAGPRLFTIEPWRPFADDLAAGLLRRQQHPSPEGADPLLLARTMLLLPSRRAIRTMQEAFLRVSAGRALLLPRMVAVGDLDSGESLAAEGQPLAVLAPTAGGDSASGAAAGPVMAPLARQLILAAILARESGEGGRDAAGALTLAAALGAALDTLTIEGKSVRQLREAVPEGLLQRHWEKNAAILATVVQHWPAILAARGASDLAERRNHELDALAGAWAERAPSFPVILAGFAAAPPAVRRLARVVARLPRGMIVLPGFEQGMAEAVWNLVRPKDESPGAREAGSGEAGSGEAGLETHPQHGMAQLLQAIGCMPGDVQPWPMGPAEPGESGAGSPPARSLLVRRALYPAALSTPAPAFPAASLSEALSGVQMVEAANPVEEALLIAIAMRQLLRQPGRTAALVTPDRALARRVVVQLRRFAIDVDDSAGIPLAESAPASLFLALAAARDERFAPVPLLALLQHPLVAAGEGRLSWLGFVRRLDKVALRGLRPAPGLDGVATRLHGGRLKDGEEDALRHWWADTAALLRPLQQPCPDAGALLRQLQEVAEALCGGEAFWAGDGGRALAALVARLRESSGDLERLKLAPGGAAAFLAALFAAEVVRPHGARHPRLHILGPLEARLQTADLVLLGGLNEGMWPRLPAPDPFLAPAIRRALGLPGLAARIGLQAQDFAAGLAAPEVLLTRSLRAEGAPTVASRFWQRLAAVAGGPIDKPRTLPAAAALLGAARAMDRPAMKPRIPRPRPGPPPAQRPRTIRVTEVAMLKADPFSFYARRVLRLFPLDPRDMEASPAVKGEVVHRIMERLVNEGLPPPARCRAVIDEELQRFSDRAAIVALWRPRVLRMVEWAVGRIRDDAAAAQWRPLFVEREGRVITDGVTLIGRIDRLDRAPDGAGAHLRVVDYKSGGVPKKKDVIGLYQTQLALLARMADEGAFGAVAGARVEALQYWKLAGGAEEGKVEEALGRGATPAAVRAHIEAAWADYRALVRRYLLGDQPFEAKLFMAYGRRFHDYDHLARLAEWLGR